MSNRKNHSFSTQQTKFSSKKGMPTTSCSHNLGGSKPLEGCKGVGKGSSAEGTWRDTDVGVGLNSSTQLGVWP